jgi:hypothetical protein
MKKVVYLLIVLGAIFTGCNPLEDINNSIDAEASPIVGIEDYTLVEDDYTNEDLLNLDVTYFESVDGAKLALPGFLSGKYPNFGQGSTVNVGYNLLVGDAEGVSDFITSDTYNLQNSDYASFGSDAFGFYPEETPEDFVPAILDAQVASPVADQLVLATFKQYTETPVVGLSNLYEATFPANFADFENVDVLGAQGWTEGPDNVQGSGFSGGANANNDWFVSPAIDLTGETDLKFQITQRINFVNGMPELFNVKISTDYTPGTAPSTATWEIFDIDKTESGDFVTSENYDFSAYDGQTIFVAFHFTSTDMVAPRWRIQSFAIKTTGVEGDTENVGEYYTYTGTEWELAEDVYYLSSADYDSMGEDFGQPGRFDNFSGSVAPEDYLPQFLDIKYPFAQEEDEIYIIYNFFNSGVSRQGNLYTFTNGEWVGDTDIIATSLQFGFNEGQWEPDNTIAYALVQADYDAIVAALSATYPGPTDSMSNFGNFERRPGNANEWTDDMVLEALNVVLDNNVPSATEAQKYVVTVAIYDGSVGTATFAVIKEGGVWVYQ